MHSHLAMAKPSKRTWQMRLRPLETERLAFPYLCWSIPYSHHIDAHSLYLFGHSWTTPDALVCPGHMGRPNTVEQLPLT